MPRGFSIPALWQPFLHKKMWRQRCATSVECDASGAKFGASIELSKVETHRHISKIVQNPGNSQPRFFYRTLLSSYIRINLFCHHKSHPHAQLPRSAPANPNPFQKPLIFGGKILGWFCWVTKQPPGISSCCSSFKDQATATFGFKDMRPLKRAFGSSKKMGATQPWPSAKKGEPGVKPAWKKTTTWECLVFQM